ncbi:MAG: Ppx/GppA family phosphatase [Nitrospirota bacterium]|nr:Ppx/GppA family phosphatase [Nitrospirota bacterium]
MVLAGIDIGTLTCRLLIATWQAGQPLGEVYSERRVLRLGEGLDRRRTLSPAAMERVRDTLREWKRMVETHQASAVAVVATSAVREAANGDEFVDLISRETGFAVEVISGEEEARRTLLGIRSGLPAGVGKMLGLDIGGGSTEFILDQPGRPPVIRSVEIGVVRLTERLLHHDPPTAVELQTAREEVRLVSHEAGDRLGDLTGATFVGTAGTITTLAAMAQKLPAYVGSRIHNYRLELETVKGLEADILSRTKAQREGLLGLELGREDVIVAGTLILRGVMETLGFQTCLVSDLGLREGVLLDLASRLRSSS